MNGELHVYMHNKDDPRSPALRSIISNKSLMLMARLQLACSAQIRSGKSTIFFSSALCSLSTLSARLAATAAAALAAAAAWSALNFLAAEADCSSRASMSSWSKSRSSSASKRFSSSGPTPISLYVGFEPPIPPAPPVPAPDPPATPSPPGAVPASVPVPVDVDVVDGGTGGTGGTGGGVSVDVNVLIATPQMTNVMMIAIARRVASHFADSISVRSSPREMVNLLLISSVAMSKRFIRARVSSFRVLSSISILLSAPWLVLPTADFLAASSHYCAGHSTELRGLHARSLCA